MSRSDIAKSEAKRWMFLKLGREEERDVSEFTQASGLPLLYPGNDGTPKQKCPCGALWENAM